MESVERSVADLELGDQEAQDGKGEFSGEDGGADSVGVSAGADQAALPKNRQGESVL